MDKVTRLASENGVAIFSKSSCCTCHAVKVLFRDLGVSYVIHEIDQDPDGNEMEKALLGWVLQHLSQLCSLVDPSTNEYNWDRRCRTQVMSLHLSGSLNPLLKPYRASN